MQSTHLINFFLLITAFSVISHCNFASSSSVSRNSAGELFRQAELLSVKANDFITEQIVAGNEEYLAVIKRDAVAIQAIVNDLREHLQGGKRLSEDEIRSIEIALQQYEHRIAQDIENVIRDANNDPNHHRTTPTVSPQPTTHPTTPTFTPTPITTHPTTHPTTPTFTPTPITTKPTTLPTTPTFTPTPITTHPTTHPTTPTFTPTPITTKPTTLPTTPTFTPTPITTHPTTHPTTPTFTPTPITTKPTTLPTTPTFTPTPITTQPTTHQTDSLTTTTTFTTPTLNPTTTDTHPITHQPEIIRNAKKLFDEAKKFIAEHPLDPRSILLRIPLEIMERILNEPDPTHDLVLLDNLIQEIQDILK